MSRKITAVERRKGINISIWEGAFATWHGVMAGGVFILGYITTMGGTYIHQALMMVMPAVALLVQLLTAYWLQFLSSRKMFTFLTAGISRLAWIPIIIIPFLFIKPTALTIFFVVYFLALIVGSMAGNSWTSWIADLVPSSLQGRFFSRRNMIATFIIYTGLLGGYFVDHGRTVNEFISGFLPATPSLTDEERLKMIGFGVLFAVGFIGAILSQIYLLRQPEPVFVKAGTPRKQIPLLQYVKVTLADKKFRYFVLLICLWNVINSISNPFWFPYRATYLQMSYSAMAICDYALGPTTRILSLLFWGKLIDRFGNKPIMMICIFLGSFHPLYYIVSNPHFTAGIYLDAISSGIMWSGVEVAITKQLLVSSPAAVKEMYFAVYAVVTSLVGVPLTMFAGWFADAFPNIMLFSLNLPQLVFLLVSIGRFFFLIPLSRIDDPNSKPVQYVLDRLWGYLRRWAFSIRRLNAPVSLNKNSVPLSNGDEESLKEKLTDQPPDSPKTG